MRKTICIFAAFSILSCGAVMAQNVESYPAYVEVSGYAEKEVAPDVFYLRVDIREADSKGKKTVEEQQKLMLTTLKGLGVDIEKQVTRLSLNSSYYNKKTNMASAAYQLKLFSADEVSRVWQKLDAMGLSGVSFVRAEYSRMDELKNEVRSQAVRNARGQALSMARAIGQDIGRCFYLYCGNSGTPVLYAQPRLAKMSLADGANSVEEAAEETLEFNNVKVTMSVQAKFVLD